MLSSDTFEIHADPYTIRESSPQRVPAELRPHLTKASNIITWSLWLFYIMFQFRFACSIQSDKKISLWRMWAALLAEVFLNVLEVVLAGGTILSLLCAKETPIPPRYRLKGSFGPTVDVLITCCGETTDVVVNTLESALAQDYPSQKFRVFVLDDGHDQKLREAVEALHKKQSRVNGAQALYRSRVLKPGVHSHFKAGNLQFGIEETERSGGSEFLACLDADMIVEPDWLRRLLPHLILNEKIALVCPPQHYYNVPEDDPLGQQVDFDIFFTIYEPLNDRLNSAMCTGSGYVVRRTALCDIGGWPLVDAGEDFMCSSLLHNAGWRIAFIRETLQSGLAPDSLKGHVKQRMRWTDSGIEVYKQFNFYFPGPEYTSKMHWTERGVGMLQALREYAPVTNVLALIFLPLAVYPTQFDVFATVPVTHSRIWLRRIYLAVYLTHKVNDFVMFGHIGLQKLANFQSNEIYMAPYSAYRCILSLLPSITLDFEPSGSIISSANERSRRHRKPLPDRLLSLDLFFCSMYIVYAALPLVLRLLAYRSSDRGSGCLFPFPGALIKLFQCIWKAAVPLHYMIFPPTVPERNELVEADEKGVRRPKKKAEMAPLNRVAWTDICEVLIIYLCYWC